MRLRGYKKYNNKKVKLDGYTFDSQKEANYYSELKLLKKAGDIYDFEVKPKYELIPKNDKFRALTFSPDFKIIYNSNGINQPVEVVDIKGSKKTLTTNYKLKKKLLYHKLGIYVKEVY